MIEIQKYIRCHFNKFRRHSSLFHLWSEDVDISVHGYTKQRMKIKLLIQFHSFIFDHEKEKHFSSFQLEYFHLKAKKIKHKHLHSDQKMRLRLSNISHDSLKPASVFLRIRISQYQKSLKQLLLPTYVTIMITIFYKCLMKYESL